MNRFERVNQKIVHSHVYNTSNKYSVVFQFKFINHLVEAYFKTRMNSFFLLTFLYIVEAYGNIIKCQSVIQDIFVYFWYPCTVGSLLDVQCKIWVLKPEQLRITSLATSAIWNDNE